jgi:effector-binding domain-containing protein
MKKVLYVIIAIGVIYLILCFFGPKQVVVEREITINKPVETVRSKLGDFKFFHDSWSPWTEKDPNMKTTYQGEPGTIGHLYTWSGNKDVQEGSMLISAINGDTIREDLTFGKHGGTVVNLISKANGNSSTVKWQMIMPVGFFGRTPMLFMNMDKMMGPDFEHGLAKLKTALEGMPDQSASNATSYEVKEMEWPETNYIGSKKETVKLQDIPAYLGKHLPAIFAELGKNKIQPEAPPSGLYWNYNESAGTLDMAAAIKAAKGSKVKGFETYSIPAGKVLQVVYFGAYDKMQPAHDAILNYMKEKNLKHSLAIEEYVTDPGVEKDTTKWMSNIYYVIGK